MRPSQTKPSLALGSFSVPHRWVLGLIVLLGLTVRAVRLDFQPLWWDEGYSVFFATRDFGTMLARTAVDIHPPLYYALLQGWMALVGKSDVALRLLSVLIGIAAIPLIYLLARELFGTRTGTLAALLLALSPFHVYYSQEVRMYGLLTLFGMGSVYCLVRLLALPAGKPKTVAYAVAYVLLTAGALYTEYYAALLGAAEILLILNVRLQISSWKTANLKSRISPSVPRGLRDNLKWLAVVALLYMPWVVYAGMQLYSYVTAKVTHESYARLDPVTYVAQEIAAFAVGHLTTWTWVPVLSAFVVVLAVLGLVANRKRAEPVGVVVLYLSVPLVLGYIINVIYPFHPVHSERLLLLASPPFYTLAALGIAALWERRAVAGAVAILLVASICAASLYDFYTVPRYPNDDYRPLIAEMQKSALPGDSVLAIYPWQIGYLETYYRGAPLNVIEAPSDVWIDHPDVMRTALEAMRREHARWWLPAFQSLGRILEEALDAYLRPRYYNVSDNWFGTTRLELFAAAEDPAAAQRPLSFENGLSPVTWGVSTARVAAGQDAMAIKLDWGDAPSGWNTSLRLTDARGNLWAQDDRDLAAGTQRIGLAIPSGTPPGEYDLRLALYRANAADQRFPAPDPLARVTVVAPAEPNLAALPHRQASDMGDISLVGYDAGSQATRPGYPAAITFYWQAIEPPKGDYSIRYELRDQGGNTFASYEGPPARGMYPTSQWKPGELVRDPQTLLIRGNTPDGTYHLTAAIVLPEGKPFLRVRVIGDVTVKARPHYFGEPQVAHRASIQIGDIARLAGYDLQHDSKMVRLVLYWQARATTDMEYHVFTHVLDANGTLVAQRDQTPGDGAYPTTSWVQNEYIVDEYTIPLPAPVDDDAMLEIGMYDPVTGARLPVLDPANPAPSDHSVLPMRIK